MLRGKSYGSPITPLRKSWRCTRYMSAYAAALTAAQARISRNAGRPAGVRVLLGDNVARIEVATGVHRGEQAVDHV